MNVLIADDEKIVLNGLQHIIDWKELGFSICGTAMDGEEALEKINNFQPDLVLLDIRMPKRNGIEVVKAAVDQGFLGKFIILSGVTDFKLAQTAMRYGVDYYLTKPIDEDELADCVTKLRKQIEQESHSQSSFRNYRERAKESILQEIMLGTCDFDRLDVIDLQLEANLYQVICYEKYNQDFYYSSWNFAELLRVTNQGGRSFDSFEIDNRKIILLKGDFAIKQFSRIRQHYESGLQKGSPFDSVFLTCGRMVSRIQDIHLSYQDIVALMKRRFFCMENQHVVGYEALEDVSSTVLPLDQTKAATYAEKFAGYIQSHNQMLQGEMLRDLAEYVRCSNAPVTEIKLYLIDIYITVRQKIMQLTGSGEIAFQANATTIELLESKFYLYEIIAFLAEQFDLWMQTLGKPSGENVMDEILYFIRQNYRENLKLETIAPLFGYNSSYLGKVFNRKVGMNFNAYLDEVRIEAAKKLLASEDMKVYEVSDLVGYSNTDYFHKKFRKYVGMTPAEYRKSL